MFTGFSLTPTMTSLAIRFERDDLPDYNLLPYPTRSAEKPDYTFELLEAELIHKGETFNVYRGPLVRSDNKFTAAVVKLAWRDSHPDAGGSLVYEYSLYLSRLKKLQGKIVPLCHGLFQGETKHGFVTALLLQDLGQENKDKLFADYGPDEKYVKSAVTMMNIRIDAGWTWSTRSSVYTKPA